MVPREVPPARLREAIAERALSAEPDQSLGQAVGTLAQAIGPCLDGAVFFGSRRTGAARADLWSAYDVFLLATGYSGFYRALRRAGLTRKPAGLLAFVSRWLPPTQIALTVGEPPVRMKAAVVETARFLRETSAARRDHFIAGRLFQPVRILHARSPAMREAILDALGRAHAETWTWVRPWLPVEFDADAYALRALEVSMGWEIRPEPEGRAAALWTAQRSLQRPVFEILLGELERAGELYPAEQGGEAGESAAPTTDSAPRWKPVRRTSRGEALRVRAYFWRSLVRATLRWAKHVVSFEGWLDYILHKAARHTGQPIVLSPRERRWPVLFLWGRVFRYLREKNRRGIPK